MPNMSYCAAENTLLALDQLASLIADGAKTKEECSDREWRAMKSLGGYVEELQMILEDWEMENEEDL